MDLTGIISVAGMGGLFKVVTQTRNGLMIESLLDGKRMPVFASHKISALEDISIYGKQDDIPLKEVFAGIKAGNQSSLPGSKATNTEIAKAFAEFVPQFDDARVYNSDMKKVFNWYQILESKGMLEDKEEDKSAKEDSSAVVSEKATKQKANLKAKAAPKNTTAKASSKGMAKTTTVRKTGG